MKSTILSILILFLFYIGLVGQQSNPFELEHRIKDKELIYKTIKEPSQNINPFEKTTAVVEAPRETDEPKEKELINPDTVQEDSQAATKEVKKDSLEIQDSEIGIKPTYTGNPFEKVTGQEVFSNPIVPNRILNGKSTNRRIKVKTNESRIKQFVFICIMIMLMMTAALSTFFRHFIFKTFESFKSDNLLRTNYRATGSTVSFPYILLEAFFIINAALTLFLIMNKLDYGSGYFLKDFGNCVLLMILIVLGKHLVLTFMAYIFPVEKDVLIYNFTISNFYIILGLILVPINLFFAFAPEVFSNILLTITAILTVLLLLYLGFRGILIGSKYLTSNRFHFFMYLCVVEIAPLFLIIKLTQNYIGI